MCGCNANKTAPTTSYTTIQTLSTEPIVNYESCVYTKEQAVLWLQKVNCIISKGLYVNLPSTSLYQLKLYVGILTSVRNYQGNPCYFKSELEEIEVFITTITSMGLCLAQ